MKHNFKQTSMFLTALKEHRTVLRVQWILLQCHGTCQRCCDSENIMWNVFIVHACLIQHKPATFKASCFFFLVSKAIVSNGNVRAHTGKDVAHFRMHHDHVIFAWQTLADRHPSASNLHYSFGEMLPGSLTSHSTLLYVHWRNFVDINRQQYCLW